MRHDPSNPPSPPPSLPPSFSFSFHPQSLDPKLTDFGMARQGDDGMSHVSTRVMGTLGYLDPAYMETGNGGCRMR